MKTLAFFLFMCISALSGVAQIVPVTFNGTGESTRIDWVQATNLNRNESVTFPGTATLNLIYIRQDDVFPSEPSFGQSPLNGVIYPNPSKGVTNVILNATLAQKARLMIRNMAGQLMAETETRIEAGQNEFNVTFSQAGVYFITVATESGSVSYKAISTEPGGSDNTVSYRGAGSYSDIEISPPGMKSGRRPYELKMTDNDVILFRCSSGSLTTLIADSPKKANEYDVVFTGCKDPSGRDYPVVDINGQTWMAENLAWLPSVSPPWEGSIDFPAYYVYGNIESNATVAKSSKNYPVYGVLYNWAAARQACPPGWRLPTDYDWYYLERSLGMSTTEIEKTGWRESGMVGCKMKETGTNHWVQFNNSPGNLSGFTALPGGFVAVAAADKHKSAFDGEGLDKASFSRLGKCAQFWTSSAVDDYLALSRRLGCTEDGVERAPGIKSFGYSVRCVKDVAVEDLVKDE